LSANGSLKSAKISRLCVEHLAKERERVAAKGEKLTAGMERWARYLEGRASIADRREALADERERIADERENAADACELEDGSPHHVAQRAKRAEQRVQRQHVAALR
jgi:hypothetical protein